MRRIAGGTYVFQQDSAPAHRARYTVQLLQQLTPEFNASDLWPPNSPDLNLVDYHVWSGVLCRNEFTRLQCVTQLISSSASLKLGSAFHKLSPTKPLASEGYGYKPASKQRDVTSSTRCNHLALIRPTKRYHTVTSSFQSHTHFIKANSYAFVCLNISNILSTHKYTQHIIKCIDELKLVHSKCNLFVFFHIC